MNYCTRCGKKFKPTDAFCTNCGAERSSRQTASGASVRQSTGSAYAYKTADSSYTRHTASATAAQKKTSYGTRQTVNSPRERRPSLRERVTAAIHSVDSLWKKVYLGSTAAYMLLLSALKDFNADVCEYAAIAGAIFSVYELIACRKKEDYEEKRPYFYISLAVATFFLIFVL